MNKSRILLVNPPADNGVKMVREGRCMQRQGAWTAVWAPISLATIGGLLRENGFEVRLVDCIVEEVDREGLAAIAGEFKPDVAIINTATPSIVNDLASAGVIRSGWGKCRTAAFGIHVTARPEESLEMEECPDAVIIGEPEATALEFARAAADGKKLDGISGIVYRNGKKIIRNSPRPPIEDLDSLPFPAWDLVNRDLYRMPLTNRRFLLITTARGCPHACDFCADTTFYGRKLRARSPAKVADEMEHVREKYGINEFLFWSESFTLDRKHAEAMADELIRRGGGFRWVCNSRVDGVDDALVLKFRDAGCWMIGFGFETGDEATLRRMKKGTTLRQAEEAVAACRRHGVEATGHFVIGYPGETEESAGRTAEFAKKLNLDFAQFYCAVPFPGSPLYERAKAKGWLATNDWRKFEQNMCVLKVDGATPEDVEKWRRSAYLKFYANPARALKILGRIRSPGDAMGIIKGLREFISWI